MCSTTLVLHETARTQSREYKGTTVHCTAAASSDPKACCGTKDANQINNQLHFLYTQPGNHANCMRHQKAIRFMLTYDIKQMSCTSISAITELLSIPYHQPSGTVQATTYRQHCSQVVELCPGFVKLVIPQCLFLHNLFDELRIVCRCVAPTLTP